MTNEKTLQQTMKAAIVSEANAPWALADRPVPEVGENDVLVRVRACGICGTDVWMANRTLPFHEFPLGPVAFQGHEVIGSAHNGMEYLAEALQIVADGKVKPMVEVFPKEKVGEAYEAASTGQARLKAVVTF